MLKKSYEAAAKFKGFIFLGIQEFLYVFFQENLVIYEIRGTPQRGKWRSNRS